MVFRYRLTDLAGLMTPQAVPLKTAECIMTRQLVLWVSGQELALEKVSAME